MPESAELLARLRKHIYGCPGGCPDCRPEIAVYCPVARPDAERLFLARRDEVLAVRLRERCGG